MRRRTKVLAAGAATAVVLGGAGVAVAAGAGGDDDGEGRPITGSELTRASKVALEHTGGGRVTGSEIDDEEGYYEIEVTMGDGSQVDVHLNRAFQVIDTTDDGSGDTEEP
jgi:hypothetical protein